MAAILGDLIQIDAVGTYYGVECHNIFYYRITNITGLGDAGYEDMIDWFLAGVIAQVQGIQNVNYTYIRIELKNLSNGVDLVIRNITPGTRSGTVTGEGLPSYVTYGFKLNRESLVTRNGYKRFSGVSEGQGSGNAYTPPTANITNLTGELAADWIFGVVNTAEPVIVKRPILVPAGAYQYSSIGSASFRGIGSQNTRKPGSGI